MASVAGPVTDRVVLWWLPLGAGDAVPIVRWNGRIFERLSAWREHRSPCDLYHAALEVVLDDVRYVVEMTPEAGAHGLDRGSVAGGPVGARWLGRSRLFRYEIHRWRDGVIPDLAHAVGGPQRVTDDPRTTRRLMALVPQFPSATWGRDEQRTGDMWNSNSLVAWLLASAGIPTSGVAPPARGRAPGWSAGLAVASRR